MTFVWFFAAMLFFFLWRMECVKRADLEGRLKKHRSSVTIKNARTKKELEELGA